MTGPNLTDDHVSSLFRWIDTIPLMAPPDVEDPAAVQRGRALFNDADVACATCHSGAKFTNNATVAVNTGGGFQVPSLRGLAWRAPYLHNGTAPTLADRFGTAGGGDMHGTPRRSPKGKSDLVAYLETL
jgi:cytochrome c peroxidase